MNNYKEIKLLHLLGKNCVVFDILYGWKILQDSKRYDKYMLNDVFANRGARNEPDKHHKITAVQYKVPVVEWLLLHY